MLPSATASRALNKMGKRNIHTIDAVNRPLGRLATEIAVLLRGKHKPDFAPYKDEGDFVVVENVGKFKTSGRKMKQKTYYWHTGYTGHLKKITMEELFSKDPAQVLRRAVLGMLSKNKLRAKMIKRLSFKN